MKKYIKSDTNKKWYTFDELSSGVKSRLVSDYLYYCYEFYLDEIGRICTEYVKDLFPNSNIHVNAKVVPNKNNDRYLAKIFGYIDYYDVLQQLKRRHYDYQIDDTEMSYLDSIITKDLQLGGDLTDEQGNFDADYFLGRLISYIDYENLPNNQSMLQDFAVCCELLIKNIEDFMDTDERFNGAGNEEEVVSDMMRQEGYWFDKNGEIIWKEDNPENHTSIKEEEEESDFDMGLPFV